MSDIDEDETAALQAFAWAEWKINPCGKPPLNLEGLPIRSEPFPANLYPCMGVTGGLDLMTGEGRDSVLNALEGQFHADPSFPGQLLCYWEGGPARDGSPWEIIIYGFGRVWPMRPEPYRPPGL